MFPRLIIFLVIFFAVIFQVSFLSNFLLVETMPSLVLLLVIFWTARKGFEKNLLRTITAGLLLDFALFDVPGTHILSFSMVSFGIGFLSKRFLVSDRFFRFLIISGIIIAGTIADMIFLDAFSRFYGWVNFEKIPFNQTAAGGYIRPWALLSNLVLFALIYPAMMKLEKFLEFYEARMSNQRKLF